jgi:hypothetical protein
MSTLCLNWSYQTCQWKSMPRRIKSYPIVKSSELIFSRIIYFFPCITRWVLSCLLFLYVCFLYPLLSIDTSYCSLIMWNTSLGSELREYIYCGLFWIKAYLASTNFANLIAYRASGTTIDMLLWKNNVFQFWYSFEVCVWILKFVYRLIFYVEFVFRHCCVM